MWIEFSDIIGLAIVLCVFILAYNNFDMQKDVKLGMIISGIAMGILYIFDMSWYIMVDLMPISSKTDFLLNFVTCIAYLMIPVAFSTFYLIYTKQKKGLRYYVGLWSVLVVGFADIINIFMPIIFYHKNSEMYYQQPFGPIMHVLCFIGFLILLIDMTITKSIDYEDLMLSVFVGATMLIGLLASLINYDVKTLWLGLGISYILMYLTVSEMYIKKDFITDLPNRNAYEKAMAHSPKNYSTILMIDMNRLKEFNDTMGHTSGDMYIRATSKTLADAFKGHGKLYRVGGDEFCLVSNDSAKLLAKIAEKLLENGRCDKKYGDFPLDFAYGIGIREEHDSPLDVYQKADKRMYKKKTEMKED